MKYIRTINGILRVMVTITTEPMFIEGRGELIGYWGYKQNGDYVIGEILTKDIIKQADTIEELCDEFVIVWKDKKHTPYIYTQLEWREFGRENFLKTKGKNDVENVYGAIWVKLPNSAYRLEPVAKMKGALPNDEIDWELL